MATTTQPQPDGWYSTPRGPMQRYEAAPAPEPAHWYLDVRDQHWHVYADAACKPTRTPLAARRIATGERLLVARREQRRAAREARP